MLPPAAAAVSVTMDEWIQAGAKHVDTLEYVSVSAMSALIAWAGAMRPGATGSAMGQP
jgi:hypothetical protein